MKAIKRSTVVGVFEDQAQADQAVNDLRMAGFRDDQIGVAMRHGMVDDSTTVADDDSQAETGALAGALTGLGLGAR
ncbi:general stress protein, partial [Singulisphaera rosea]